MRQKSILKVVISTVVSDKEKCMHGMACNLFNLYYFDINNTLKLIIWNIDKIQNKLNNGY